MSGRGKLLVGVGLALASALGAVVYNNRASTILRLASGPSIVVVRDVVYRPGSPHPKHRLDVYAPRGAKGAPVVHFIHGGYWTKGDKDFHRLVTGLYGSVGEALARRGVVAVVPSYRLAPEVLIEGIVDDVMAALRWTQAHAAEHGGHPGRIFVMGHSAGGHLTALVGSDPALHTTRGMNPLAVRGYIPLSAVWDVADMHAKQDAAFNERVTYPVFGKDPNGWRDRSPLQLLGAGARPFFVVVGERDYPYMIPQAERARDRLKELRAAPRWLVVPGNDHDEMVLRFGAKDDNISAAVVDFVNES